MSHVTPILLLFVFFFAGMLTARLTPFRHSRIIEVLSGLILPALLLVMGYRISLTAESGRELARAGMTAAVFALCTVAGTLLAAGALCLLDRKKPGRGEGTVPVKAAGWRGPVFLLLMVAAGFILGILLPENSFTGAGVTTWLLRFLLFSIGIDMVKSGVSFAASVTDRDTVLLPLLTAAGSLAGGAAAAVLLGMNIWKGLSVASGFGWYTLSGVLIDGLGDPLLGSAAFMTNMFREALAIVMIPFLGRTIFARAAVGVAGATSMDVTLPLVERASGPAMVPLSMSHGVLLSLLVPLLVPLFYRLG